LLAHHCLNGKIVAITGWTGFLAAKLGAEGKSDCDHAQSHLWKGFRERDQGGSGCPLKLHVLSNNAGIMAFSDQATKDGYDWMQTNRLSHFLLTREISS